jgi:hypothetical protein
MVVIELLMCQTHTRDTQSRRDRGIQPKAHRFPKIWGYGTVNGKPVIFWGRDNRISAVKEIKSKARQSQAAQREIHQQAGYVEIQDPGLDFSKTRYK